MEPPLYQMQQALQRYSQKPAIATEVLTLVGVVAMWMLSLSWWQLRDAISVSGAMTVAMVAAVTLTRACCRPTRAIDMAVRVISLMLWAFTIANMHDWTVVAEHSLTDPYLCADDKRYWAWAVHYTNGSLPLPSPPVQFPGYPAIIRLMFGMFGINLAWPMALNLFATIMSITLTGSIARRFLDDECVDRRDTVALYAIIITATMAYFVSQGVRMQKEALVYLAMALTIYAFAGFWRNDEKRRLYDAVAFVAGCALMAVMRTTYLYFILLGLAMVALPHLRANKRYYAVLAVLAVLIMSCGNYFAKYAFTGHLEIISGGDVMEAQFITGENQHAYLLMMGHYFWYSPLHRAVLLPLTMAVQFVIPFPWLYSVSLSVDVLLPRLQWTWYVVGGIVLFYYFFVAWRKGCNLGVVPLWFALCYVIIAYITAGSVSRYILPFMPVIVTTSIFTVIKVWRSGKRRVFYSFMAIYGVVLLVTLLVCYNIQTGYISALADYYRALFL